VVQVKFITAEGATVLAEAAAGESLLSAGQAAGMPLEGTCEAQMACSTCHVVIAKDWFAKLTPATDDEEDMLDLAAGVQRTSRLSCQIELTDALNGIEVHIPGESRDMQRR
jgi:ferredoxin